MKRSLRVVVVTESFLPQVNGVTNSVLRVLEHLRAEGHQALVIAPESAGGITEYAGFRVKRVPSLEMMGLLPVGFPQKAIEPLIDGFNPGFARHYGLTIAHDSLKKWVAKIHRRTTRTLAPSNWSCEDLKTTGVSNVHLWPRGVDSEKFNPQKRDINLRCELLGNRPDRKLVGYVGRLANEKRIDDLATLDARDDIQLVIVGDGPARSRLERVLKNAKFVGYQSGEDLARHYASLDIFIHTGKHETFCQSVQEALASGIPVIAPNFGGPTDLVKHGWTGYLIDTANTYSLNHAVNQIIQLAEPALMGARARESVIERTWQSVNAQLISHYTELVELKSQEAGVKVA